jgi:hypothetical protein
MKSKLVISLFAMCGAVGSVGCGGGDNGGEVKSIDGSAKKQFVASKVTLPKNSMSLAFDLDGDGTADNRLGNIIQAISALNLDPQSSADDAVASGSLLLLIEAQSTDASMQAASNAGAKLALGTKPATPPTFDGNDALTVSTATQPAQFYGNITAGTFVSNNPATTENPVTLTLGLPLVEGQPPLILPVTGGRITYKVGTDGKITGGQINGAVKKTDVDTVIIPAVAMLVTAELAKPDPSTALKMFDPNMDGTVTADEIKMNSLISNFLAADIQLFENGVYKPNPAKTNKDSLSLGLGFDAVAATF